MRNKRIENNINKGEIVIYKSPRGPEIQVKLEKDTVWLDAHLIARLFNVNRPAIVKHINNIYKTEELDKKPTCSILEQVAADGKVFVGEGLHPLPSARLKPRTILYRLDSRLKHSGMTKRRNGVH